MLRAAFSHSPLPMGGLYDGVVTGCSGVGAFHRNVSQMEIPGGGGTSPVILPKEVLRVVTPLKEVVIPYTGVHSVIWLHEVRVVNEGTPAHLQFVSR